MSKENKLQEAIEDMSTRINKNMNKPEDKQTVIPPVYGDAVETEKETKKKIGKVFKDLEKKVDGITLEEPSTGKEVKTDYTKKFELSESLFDEGYELLNGKKVQMFKDFNKAKEVAEKLGLKEAEYGDAYGVSYCFWNKDGDRNKDEEVIAYYKFVGGKPTPLSDDEAEKIEKVVEAEFDEEEVDEGCSECKLTEDKVDDKILDKTIKVYDINDFIDKEVNPDSDVQYKAWHLGDGAAILVKADGSGCIVDYEAVGSDFDSVDDLVRIDICPKDEVGEDGRTRVHLVPTASFKVPVSDLMKAPSKEMKVRDFFRKWDYNDRCRRNFDGIKEFLVEGKKASKRGSITEGKTIEGLPNTLYSLVYNKLFPTLLHNYKVTVMPELNTNYDASDFYDRGLGDYDIGVVVESEKDGEPIKKIADFFKLKYEYKPHSQLKDGKNGIAIIRISDDMAEKDAEDYLKEIGVEQKPYEKKSKGKKNESLKESKVLNEGPGAGYEISATTSAKKINSFEFVDATNYSTKWGGIDVDCQCDIDAETTDIYAASYMYDTLSHFSKEHIPSKITRVAFSVDLERAIGGFIDENAQWEDFSAEDILKILNDNKEKFYSDIIEYSLQNIKTEIVYGGGWSHSTYDGTINTYSDYIVSTTTYNQSDFECYAVDIELTDKDAIDYIDKAVSGDTESTVYYAISFDGDEVEYWEEAFDTAEEAIAYAKKSDCKKVYEVREILDYDGDIYDSDYVETVWTKGVDEEVDESLKEDVVIKKEYTLDEYEPWSGAKDWYKVIEEQGKLAELDRFLEEVYPDGIDETELNDLIWFEPEWVFENIGIKYDFQNDKVIEDDEEVESEEDEE